MVDAGDLPFDRTMKISTAEEHAKQKIAARIPYNLKTIKKLLEMNANDWEALEELREKSRPGVTLQWNIDVLDRSKPAWLDDGSDKFEAVVAMLPLRDHIDVPVREQLIVELYSK